METRVVTAHIPVELAQQVDAIAARMERPRGWIVKQALTAWAALEDKRYRLTLEGLADIEAGRIVDHSVIDVWAKSLDDGLTNGD